MHRKTKYFWMILIASSLGVTAGSPAGERHPIDPTTGQTLGRNSRPDLQPINDENWTSQKVLWDVSHGVLADYQPSGRYSGWRKLMEAKGLVIVEDHNGVLSHKLEGYSGLVINVASAWFTPYTLAETALIAQFVSQGGSLLIMGDNAGAPNDHINPISLVFGTNIGLSIITPYNLFFSRFAVHRVFREIEEINFIAAGEIRTLSPAQALAWTDISETVIAGGQYGLGRVLITGDVNFMDNFFIGQSDNQRFSEDLFDWLLPRLSTMPQQYNAHLEQ